MTGPIITFWPNLLDPAGSEWQAPDWETVLTRLSQRREFMGDREHPGWSPARLDPCQRAAENVRELCGLCLDFDGGTSVEWALDKFKAFLGLVQTTRKHTPEVHRFRVVLPLSRAVSPFEHGALWKRVALWCGNVDPSTKDPGRFWFLPGTKPGAEFRAERLAGVGALNVDAWLKRDLPTPKPTRVERTSDPSNIELRALKYIAKMPDAVAGQHGHDATWQVACALACGFDLTEETTFRILANEYNGRCQPSWSEKELRHKAKQARNNSKLERGYLLREEREWAPAARVNAPAPAPTQPTETREPGDDPEPYEPAAFEEIATEPILPKPLHERFPIFTERQLIKQVFDHVTSNQPKRGFTTGVREIDELLGGLRNGMITCVGAQTSWGKCLGPDVPVMRADGTAAFARDVRAGDLLMGPDSKPRRVLTTTSGSGPMYRIIPERGTPWTCNWAHVMVVVDTSNSVVTEISVEDFFKRTPTWRNYQKLFHVGINYPSAPEPKIDPWFLGVWAGDGTKDLHSVQITTPDNEVIVGLHEIAGFWGQHVRENRKPNNQAATFSICGERTGGKANPLLDALRGEAGDDGLPESCLFGSRSTRLAFLAGLIDSDGYKKGDRYCEIVTQHKLWAEQIRQLCRSLGLQCHLYEKTGVPGYEGRVYWRAHISGNLSVVPTRVVRKQFPDTSSARRHPNRTGFVIEPIGESQFNGWELDGDGLFLLADMTVTHNSTLATMVLEENLPLGVKVLLVSNEDQPLLYGRRIVCRRGGLNALRVRDGELDAREISKISDIGRAASHDYVLLNAIGMPAEAISEAILACREELGTQLVMVDYLQRVRMRATMQDRRNEVSRAAECVGDAIKKSTPGTKLDAPASGLVFSQLKRIQDKPPTIEDLKESGDVENMAEHIVLGWRKTKGDKVSRMWSLPKNKDGPVVIDWCELEFNHVTASFTGKSTDDRPEAVQQFDDLGAVADINDWRNR